MNKEQAKTLIKHTFEASFDKEKFTKFIIQFLNLKIARIENKHPYSGNLIPDAYKQSISTLQRIAKYSESENEIDVLIDVLIVKLKKETSLERARTMQRNFIAWYLKGSRGGIFKNAALVAFVPPTKDLSAKASAQAGDWRFSLVKIDYIFDEDGKVITEKSPARRWSFLVGENEKSHTAQSQLVNILRDDEHDPTLEEIEKAFDIETVTKEFFLKYRELFLRTKEELDRVVKNDPKIKDDFESKDVDTVNFAKKLLGQIIFLYFLQKKGWFGVGRDDDWGTGSKHFLRELFEKNHGDYKNFFNDILEPLFYEALRRDRSDDDGYYSRFNCKIPFLNGGLFDPIGSDRGYNWVDTDIFLPDKLFSNTNKTKEGDTGTGILDIFDRYNFTVKEDEPLEKEVAIDPELLGKSYEKFNAIRPDNYDEFKKALKSGKRGEENKFNKKFGVYYTPREIVHYMCQQSLINYLATEFTDCHSRFTSRYSRESGNPVVSKKDIETLIHTGEQVSENEARVLRKGKETETYSHKLPESIRKNAKLIDEKLADITVCDPAVGSGAFPVGMMAEIVKTRNVLTTYISYISSSLTGEDKGEGEKESRNPYKFKRDCIENSLYGVDIDPGAVEIAKLRLWLSLVVDEEDIKNIKPLPNLDYKIVCGNSLLGVEKDLFNANLFSELEKLKPLFFNETNPTKKQEYKKQIDKLISEITSGHTEFDFEVYFSEVFLSGAKSASGGHEKACPERSRRGGFDVVIANPPYHIFSKDEFNSRYKEYFHMQEGKPDLYRLFIERAFGLMGKNAVSSFIIPNTFLTIPSAEKLRRYIIDNLSIVTVVNYNQTVFESASVNNIVYVFQKSIPDESYIVTAIDLSEDETIDQSKKISINQLDFKHNPKCQLNIFIDEAMHTVIDKITLKGKPLGNFNDVYITLGLQPYHNTLHTKQQIESRFLHSNIRENRNFFIELGGKNVHKYYVRVEGSTFLDYSAELYTKPDLDYFKGERIILREIVSDSLIAGYTDETALFNKSCYIIKSLRKQSTNKYLLGLLNSRVLGFYVKNTGDKSKQVLFPRITMRTIKSLPIVSLEDSHGSSEIISIAGKIEILVDRILISKGINLNTDISELEAEIERLVYKLYGLTEEEIKIVESSS